VSFYANAYIFFDDEYTYQRPEFSDDDDVDDDFTTEADGESGEISVHRDSPGRWNVGKYDSDKESVFPSEMSDINIQLPDTSRRFQIRVSPPLFNIISYTYVYGFITATG